MMEESKELNGGIYLVVDPSMPKEQLLEKLEKALEGGVCIVQVWNNWKKTKNIESLLGQILDLCQRYTVPAIINNDWKLLKEFPFDGIHFDDVPQSIDAIRREIGRNFAAGITCNNDLSVIDWANNNDFDYVSFCSVFPSSTSNSCELVTPATVVKARGMTSLPIFLAGGINQKSLAKLSDFEFDGLAIISGIMNAQSPQIETKKFVQFIESRK